MKSQKLKVLLQSFSSQIWINRLINMLIQRLLHAFLSEFCYFNYIANVITLDLDNNINADFGI